MSADGRLTPGSRAPERAAAGGAAKGCAPPGKAAAKAGRGDAARDDGPDADAAPAEGTHTHSLPGSRLLPVRWKDPLTSLCRQTLNRRAQRVKSPDLPHHLPSRLPRMEESFPGTCDFRKHSPGPLSAHLCRQRRCLPVLAGTAPAFGWQEGFRTRESRLKSTVTRIFKFCQVNKKLGGGSGGNPCCNLQEEV